MILHQLRNRTCVNCNASVPFSILHASPAVSKKALGNGQIEWIEGPLIRAMVVCGNCHQPSLVELKPRPNVHGHLMHSHPHIQASFLNRLKPLASIFQNAPENIKHHWAVLGNEPGTVIDDYFEVVQEFPSAAVQRPDSAALPENVNTQLNRLIKVLHEPVAAMAHCRRTLEMACKEKLGEAAKGKRLYELIDATLQSVEATREIAEWAHTIRHLGNDAAHANDSDPTEQEAHQAYEVVRLMLDLLFEYPARIRQLRRA
ncbi:MAG TPA: DUF4145 domain-containing protein [Pseudomonas sp.]